MRAFGYEERDRFFGRDQQSYALYRLLSFGFISVIGNSGSGKSSLVRAGLLPILLGPRETTRWRIATMTPGAEPLERLEEAIAELGPEDEDDDARSIRRERIAYRLRLSSSGIADALDEMPYLAGDSVLLIVDQFEEIFRSPSAGAENEAFVQLLLEFHRRRPSGRVLITMRSDFIGDCALFPGLPEAVSDTQYLVPTLTREQRRAAICKPIAAANATIESDLVERLLNEEDFGTDLLPILQHALSRMWIVAHGRSTDAVHVTHADYRAIGTLAGAISEHADGVLRELRGREDVAESVFRALSERDPDGRATRRIRSLRQLVAETGASDDDVRTIVDRFRAPDCAFLLPASGDLTSETRIDVVHEALLRRWERLTPSDSSEHGWLDREEEDGRYYRSLLARIDSGETTLQLDRVTERYAWWTSRPHTTAWATRYGGRRERVEAFFHASLAALAESQRAKARAEADELERRKQEERATRRFLIVSGSISTIAIVLLVVTFLALLGSQRTTNSSLVTQSELVARDARGFADRGDATDAALLALEVLPQHLSDPDRPFTWAAYGALTDALANARETRDYRLSGTILRIEYSPDGTRFVARGGDGTIWIWKLGAPKPELVLHAQSFARDLEFSADGSFIASGSSDGTVHIWKRSGSSMRVLHACRGAANRAEFTLDGGRLLVSCEEENVTRLYDVRSGRMRREVPGGIDSLWSRKGTVRDRLITIEDARVTIRNASLTKALHVFGPAPAAIVDAAMTLGEDKIVIAYADRTAGVFDARTGRRLSRLVSRDQTAITNIRFDPSGTYVCAISNASVSLWNASTGEAFPAIPADNLSVIPELSRDGEETLIRGSDGLLAVYSAKLGVRLVNVAGSSTSTNGGSFSPDGKRLLVANLSDGIVRELDLSKAVSRVLDQTIDSGRLASDFVNIATTPDGATFAVSDGKALRFFDARTGRLVRSIPDVATNSADISQAAFSPDGRTLLVMGNEYRATQRWDWRRSKRLPSFSGATTTGPPSRHYPTYAPDGKTLAVTFGNVLRIEDARTGRTRLSLRANQHQLCSVAFSPDGERLLTGSDDGWIRVYDARSGRPMLALRAHDNRVHSARFSPDGRLIASASLDQSVRVWNAANGAPIASLDTNGLALSVAFSSDGRRLLIGGEDGARIWDFATDRTVIGLRGFVGGIYYAEFARHDSRVVTIGADNTLRLWTVPELPVCQQAIDEAPARLAHDLTPALRNAEFISPRHAPSLLNALLPSQACS